MTFSMKDVVWLIPLVEAYMTIWANKKRIEKVEKNTEIKDRVAILEQKYDDFKDNFGKLELQLAKLRFEIVKDIVKEVKEIFGNKK